MATATATRARHGSYLFQRPGSQNWYVRLRSPGKTVVRSLGTSDKAKAEIAALGGVKLDDGTVVSIGTHKAALLAARPRLEPAWLHTLEPGREHVAPDGGRIIATDRELIYMGHNGSILKTEPNGQPVNRLVNVPMGAVIVSDTPARPLAELRRQYKGAAIINLDTLENPATGKHPDDAIIADYLKHGGRKGAGITDPHFRREIEATWETFKSLTKNKPLRQCFVADGRLLVAHYQNAGLKSATVQKKVGWLSSAIKHAIHNVKEDDKDPLVRNPFSGISPDLDDAAKREPFDAADIATIKGKLGGLSAEDQLLVRLLGSSGMRLEEAFQIKGEEPREDGIRFVIVGTKSKQTMRRVPFPETLLPFLPDAINGPLFAADVPHRFAKATLRRLAASASKRLNRFVDDCGIVDPNKVVHSFRHRAEDRARIAKRVLNCDSDELRHAVLGHDGKKTVAKGYGEGFPVAWHKELIDQIGF